MGIRRVEFQLNRKFLRCNQIRDVFAFQLLMQVLPGRHFYFATLDLSKVLQHLRNAGHDPPEIRRILERVAEAEGNLHAQCRILRKRGKLLKNEPGMLRQIASKNNWGASVRQSSEV